MATRVMLLTARVALDRVDPDTEDHRRLARAVGRGMSEICAEDPAAYRAWVWRRSGWSAEEAGALAGIPEGEAAEAIRRVECRMRTLRVEV